MLAAGKPILGICGGEQLLNVFWAARLSSTSPDSVKNALGHEQENPRTEPGHTVCHIRHAPAPHHRGNRNSGQQRPSPGRGYGRQRRNRLRHSVRRGDRGHRISAHPFCLGIQWHPEYHQPGRYENLRGVGGSVPQTLMNRYSALAWRISAAVIIPTCATFTECSLPSRLCSQKVRLAQTDTVFVC